MITQVVPQCINHSCSYRQLTDEQWKILEPAQPCARATPRWVRETSERPQLGAATYQETATIIWIYSVHRKRHRLRYLAVWDRLMCGSFPSLMKDPSDFGSKLTNPIDARAY